MTKNFSQIFKELIWTLINKYFITWFAWMCDAVLLELLVWQKYLRLLDFLFSFIFFFISLFLPLRTRDDIQDKFSTILELNSHPFNLYSVLWTISVIFLSLLIMTKRLKLDWIDWSEGEYNTEIFKCQSIEVLTKRYRFLNVKSRTILRFSFMKYFYDI